MSNFYLETKLGYDKKQELIREISTVLNRNNIDTEMNIADFILATYMVETLLSLDSVIIWNKEVSKNN